MAFCQAGGGGGQWQQQQAAVADAEPTNYAFAFTADSHSREESREGNVVRGQVTSNSLIDER